MNVSCFNIYFDRVYVGVMLLFKPPLTIPELGGVRGGQNKFRIFLLLTRGCRCVSIQSIGNQRMSSSLVMTFSFCSSSNNWMSSEPVSSLLVGSIMQMSMAGAV